MISGSPSLLFLPSREAFLLFDFDIRDRSEAASDFRRRRSCFMRSVSCRFSILSSFLASFSSNFLRAARMRSSLLSGSVSERREMKEKGLSTLVRVEGELAMKSADRFVSVLILPRPNFDLDDFPERPDLIERFDTEGLVNLGTAPKLAAVYDCESGVGAGT